MTPERPAPSAPARHALEELPQLRAAVRALGARLGEVIARLEGAPTLRLVEELRHRAKESRAGDGAASTQLAARVRRLTPSVALNQAMAFTLFFELVNLAEENFRVRLLRARRADAGARKESIAAAIAELKRRRVPAAEVRRLLDRLAIELVFTAHPTEAKRRTLLTKLAALAEVLRLTPVDAIAASREIEREIVSLWLTDRGRPAPPTVVDEARTGLWYFERTLYRVLPELQADLETALAQHYPGLRAPRGWLRFGSWIGGDRDGNPYVTARVTRTVLGLQRELAVTAMKRSLQRLAWSLTVSALREPASPQVTRLARELGRGVGEWGEIRDRHAQEPYRQLIYVLRARLSDATHPLTEAELKRALATIEASLRGSRAAVLADGVLQEVANRAATFGLHAAALDTRQHTAVHARAVAELLGRNDYPDLPEHEKRGLLARAIARRARLQPGPEATTALATLAALRSASPAALGLYIVSMTADVSDLLEVVWLQTIAGTALPVAPLFETLDDLHRAPVVLDELWCDPTYRRWLRRSGNHQHVMLGYSDSNKDAGYLAANWALHEAQEQIAAVARRHGVRLTLFHGRGGSIARGGGPAAMAVLAQPVGLHDGGIRVTEQGEVLSTRYHDPDIAHRVLEQMSYGVILGAHAARAKRRTGLDPAWRAAMDAMGAHSTEVYRALVHDPEFLVFWQQATPIDEIGELKLGSRPSYRKEGPRTLADLRAIPWVFSWMQSRYNLPGWFGLGSALEHAAAGEGGLERLRAMYRDWLFFRQLIDNTQLTLGKADLGIARVYAGLVSDAALRERIFARIAAEFRRTEKWVLAVAGQEKLLGGEPVLANSIRLRNPYIDPLNYLQVEMLRRLRAGGLSVAQRREAKRVIEITVNGIAAGLKNTG